MEILRKSRRDADDAVLKDYPSACADFSWEQARSWLDGLPGGGLNIAHEAVDRHAEGPAGERTAIRWLGKAGTRREIRYRELAELSSRFANVLDSLGVARGAGVYLLAGRIPELYLAMLGALKHGAVVTPLFSAFGPEPIATRMTLGEGRVLVTTTSLYRRKVARIRDRLPSLEHVLVIRDGEDHEALPEGTRELAPLLEAAAPDYTIPATDPETPALLHYTSGTTGKPKASTSATSGAPPRE